VSKLAVPEISLGIGAAKFKMDHLTLTTLFWGWFVRRMLGLDIAYLITKFDHSSFSRSRDMVGANQNLNSSRDLTTPLW